MKRHQAALEFGDTLIFLRETIKMAIMDSIAYPPKPQNTGNYYAQRLYAYNKTQLAKDHARHWFRTLGETADGFKLMWHGIVLCGGPDVPAERILSRLEEIWDICDKDPSQAEGWCRSIRHASTVFNGEEDE